MTRTEAHNVLMLEMQAAAKKDPTWSGVVSGMYFFQQKAIDLIMDVDRLASEVSRLRVLQGGVSPSGGVCVDPSFPIGSHVEFSAPYRSMVGFSWFVAQGDRGVVLAVVGDPNDVQVYVQMDGRKFWLWVPAATLKVIPCE